MTNEITFTITVNEDGSGEMDGWPFEGMNTAASAILTKAGEYEISEGDAENWTINGNDTLIYG
jgi:hypothetical protein